MKRITIALFLILVLLTHILSAQDMNDQAYKNPAMDLGGYNSLFILAGTQLMRPVSTALVSPEGVSSKMNFIGLLGYQYWFNNEWSIAVSGGVVSLESNVDYSGISSVNITPLLFGFAYYPADVALGNTGRVYIGLDAGVYIRTGSLVGLTVDDFGPKSVTETAFGAAPKVGIDFFVKDWLRLGPVLSYHFVMEYDESLGGRTNYSGPALSLDLGVLF